MATRVGTGVTGEGDALSTTISTASKSTTTGNTLVLFVKWENAGTVTSITDTAGNTWTIQDQYAVQPGACIAYAQNITGNAANVVTVTFSAAADFRRVTVEEVAGLGSAGLDGTPTKNTGNGLSFSTGNITTTTSGYVFYGQAHFSEISGIADGSTPGFTLGPSISTGFTGSLLSGSAQTVTIAASASSTSDLWRMMAVAFKDGVPATPPHARSYSPDGQRVMTVLRM